MHAIFRGLFINEVVAIFTEFFQTIRRIDLILHDIARHRAARAFGKKADDFVAAAFFVFLHGRDYRHIQSFEWNRFEIFLRREVNQHFVFVRRQFGIELLDQLLAPKRV